MVPSFINHVLNVLIAVAKLPFQILPRMNHPIRQFYYARLTTSRDFMKEVSLTMKSIVSSNLLLNYIGSYLGGDKFQVKADRDVHAKERRQSHGTLAPPAVRQRSLSDSLLV